MTHQFGKNVRFEFILSDRLPIMAWLACVRRQSERINVWHGSHVSRGDGVFWEGINPTPREPAAVIRHHFPLSSGGVIDGNQLVFFTPGHVLERLFCIRDSESLWVSNSLPLVLAASGSELSKRYVAYPAEFELITSHDRCFPLQGTKELRVFYNCNIRVHDDLQYEVEPRVTNYNFSTYQNYVGSLQKFIEEMLTANGKGENRSYLPLSTLSRGYDSTAITVLARKFGVSEALSIKEARIYGPNSENVTDTADFLGIKLQSINRLDYAKYGFEAEKLFFVTALADEICFYPFVNSLRGRLLFVGVHGDSIWDRNAHPVGTWRRDNAGASMQEFRIRTGFVLFPLAFFGWQHHADIIRLSRSDEMRPWAVGGTYDRPIPRRIAEEAKLARTSFGTKKMAVTVTAGARGEGANLSLELQRKLEEHWVDNYSRAMRVTLGVMNRALYSAQDLFYSLQNSAADIPQQAENHSGSSQFVRNALTSIKYSHFRRKYVRPILPVTFAAQVTNNMLIHEYAGLLD